MKKILLTNVALTVLILLLRILMKLTIWQMILLEGFGIFTVLYCTKKRKLGKDKKKIAQMEMTYLQYLLYAFKRHYKMTYALEECGRALSGERKLASAICEAKEKWTKGEGRDAFASVEMKLCGEIVARTHDMISHIALKGEEYWGQWEVMINQLLRYRETRQRFWEQIQEVYQQFHISLGFSFLLCVVSSVMVPRGMLENMMLVPMYVVSLTLVVVGFFMSVIWMYRKILSSKHSQRCNQDSSMSRKEDFAEWIDDVLMRLPKMSTYQALQTSKRVADWMEPFVDKFVDDIYNEPTSICPYVNFAKKIQVEESEKLLCLLYAIQREDKERFDSQLQELEVCQMTMKEQIEENRRQREIIYFSRGRQIPFFLAGVKIVLDLVGYSYLMLQQLALGS